MLGRKSHEKLTEREQVAKRREEVLSRGRKFKYPLQYAKHRVAIIASIISVVALAGLAGITYAALYIFGSSHDIFYHATQLFPLSVAEVSGEKVRFSDYLLLYRSSIAVVSSSDENRAATEAEYKRASLDTAEKYTYAIKLARELDIEVTSEEIAELFEAHKKAGGTERSEESFLKILADNFGINKAEYNSLLRLLLTKTKVSAAIDTEATKLRDSAAELSQLNNDLSAVADRLGGDIGYEDTGGLLALDSIDGGRAAVAFTLEPDQVSAPFLSNSGDAYYIVRLFEKTETEVNYASLRIPLTEFDRRFDEVIEAGNYEEYITIASPENNPE